MVYCSVEWCLTTAISHPSISTSNHTTPPLISITFQDSKKNPMTPDDSEAVRNIHSCEVTLEAAEGTNTPFVRVDIVGQSFILNQIRKMMGLAVAAVRGHCSAEILENSLSQDHFVEVPMAPQSHLFLTRAFFDWYMLPPLINALGTPQVQTGSDLWLVVWQGRDPPEQGLKEGFHAWLQTQ